MPVSTYIRFRNLIPVDIGHLHLSELGMSSDNGATQSAIYSITSTIAPTTGSLANLYDGNPTTEAYWEYGGGMPELIIEFQNTSSGIEQFTHIRQASGSVVNDQIASVTIENYSILDGWIPIHSGNINTASSVNTYAEWTKLFSLLITDTVYTTEAVSGWPYISYAVTDTATIIEAITRYYRYLNTQSDSSNMSDTLEYTIFTLYLEAVGLSDSIKSTSHTTSSIADKASILDIVSQAINQIVHDNITGHSNLNLGAALSLVEIADAFSSQDITCSNVILVAELIATIESLNNASSYDITDSGVLSDAYVERVRALAAIIETAQAVSTNTALVRIIQPASDSANLTTEITSAGSLLKALLNDAALATIRLNIGGDLFTGWVLNTETMAPSEYQFADLQFNSACKHGDTYLLAADDGIYQFTEETNVETVMTYIKTGKTDFGSDMRKGVTNAYMVYSAIGQMTLKVTTSANGVLQTNDYAMVPFAATETPDPQRVTIGKGIKSRYWQFELTGANAGCKFDEIGMLPVVLSRRI